MDTRIEEWRYSPLAPPHVQVSNHGRARTLDRHALINHGQRKGLTQLRKGVILSPWIGNAGYLIITIKEADKRTKHLLHRLVASAFCEGFDRCLTVNHKDGNKLNNYPSNLEWVTLGENTEHQWRIGLVNLRGELHPNSKLKQDQVTEIRSRLNGGESLRSISEKFNVSTSIIHKIKTGARWAASK